MRFIDPDGMLAGDYYDGNGKHIGTDGIDDGKKYIVTSEGDAKCVKQNDKAGKTTQTEHVSSAIPVPSSDQMYAANQAVENTAATGKENGFVAATDGNVSNLIPGDEGQVKLAPGYAEIEGQGRQAAFDVHTHPNAVTINGDGSFVADDPNPSGTPAMNGQPARGGDYGYTGAKENQGQATSPSWVIGSQTSVTSSGGSFTTKQTQVITFYNSQGAVGQLNWTQFQETVGKINK